MMILLTKFRLLLPILCLITATSLAKAQGTPQVEALLVELWPEFDRPEVLVIYRLELSADTPLPATLTFALPGYIEAMNAVAYAQDGNLLAVEEDAIETTYRDDTLFLTFSTPSSLVQLEYYDDEIITRQEQARSIAYTFTAPYRVDELELQVQVPAQAEEFSLSPPPDETFTDPNGLTYNRVAATDLAGGDTLSLNATYQRATDALTLELLTPVSEHAEDIIPVTATPPTDTNVFIAYGLAGVGTLLILGAATHWWWHRSRVEPAPTRRPATRSRSRSRQPVKNRSASSQTEPATAGFCYQCGTALRPDSNFCHICGAKRRT